MEQDVSIFINEKRDPMDFFFNPDGIAVVGASNNALRGGYYLLNNVLEGYKGRVYPVNPRYETIQGIKCYPDIASIPEDIELVIYFAPARSLPETIEQCSQKGVKGIIIESAGFSEVGEQGKVLQQRVSELAARYGIRLWGPNCMGLLDAHSRHVFSFMSWMEWKDFMRPGNVSLIVQSGMLSAGFLMMMLERGGMGISKVCSIGNKCDVNEIELLDYIVRDNNTDVIGLYLESMADGRKFMDIIRSTNKPVIVLKGGRSAFGAKAAISHTASMAGNNAIIESAFRQAGVIQVKDVSELMDFLRGFSKIRRMKPGRGTAIVTFSGGGGIVTADFLHDFGLDLAELSQHTLARIKNVFPDWMDPSNPVDIWPAVEKNGAEKVYPEVIDALFQDPGVDSVILHVFASGKISQRYLEGLAMMQHRYEKPILIWLVGIGEKYAETRLAVENAGMAVFTEIGRAVSVLSGIKKHYQGRGSLA